jgi:ATP-dependent DNA helicase RecG
MTPHVATQVSTEVTVQVATICRKSNTAEAIMAEPILKPWKTFQSDYRAPVMAIGILERTIFDKPRSRLQRYRTTEAGLAKLSTYQVSPSSSGCKAPLPRGTRG